MTGELPNHTVGEFIGRTTGYIAEALRYWEPRRLFYNGIMAVVVIGRIATNWKHDRAALSFDLLLFLFLLAVLANVCFCAVYVVDLFVRFSGLEAAWEKGRVVVLLIGTAF